MTTAKTAAVQADDTQPTAAINLDTLEREGGTPAPFDFILDGQRFMLSDPKEVDWQDMMAAMSDPVMFFRLTLPPENHRSFFSTRLPSWKLNALMASYMEHYGLPSPDSRGALLR